VLAGGDDAQWTLSEPWRSLLDRAATAGTSAEAEAKEQLEEALEREPRKGRAGLVREHELQGRRARRRAHTASLDRGLELVATWFRDLVAVASGAEEHVFNSDRLDALRTAAADRTVAGLLYCVELCEDTRRRLERNVLEDLALEALFNRMRRASAA
jgi:hypothetical protein